MEALAVADSVAAVAGPALVSLILHGSMATGEYRPGVSDIDLMLIVRAPLPDPEPLIDVVRRSAGPVDLHVLTAEAVAHPSPAPPLELFVGPDLEVTYRSAGDPDLPAELSEARAHGRALSGAEPADVIAPVPASFVRERGAHWLRTWLTLTDDTEHAVFMTVTACRMWRFATEGVHCGKRAAAGWALARDPGLSAVRQVLDGGVPGPAEIEALLRTVLRDAR